jgi:hypothetical protein
MSDVTPDGCFDKSSATCRLVEQLSSADCTYGTSFGCNEGTTEMWVSSGCRGVFACGDNKEVTCESENDAEATCEC